MEYRTIQKNVGDSPRKVRLVADMIRGMTPEQAIEVLRFTNKAAAVPLMKAIKTVIANASTSSPLKFKSIEINEGLKMRRYRVGTAGRGRGRPYRKRFSQIKVVLTDDLILPTTKLGKTQGSQLNRKGGKQKQAAMADSTVKAESTEKSESEATKK